MAQVKQTKAALRAIRYQHELLQGDCLERIAELDPVKCIFADPPDNIDLGYGEYKDKMPDHEYVTLLGKWINTFARKAEIVWFSFNARWTAEVGAIINDLVQVSRFEGARYEYKPCVQVFTFGQHNKNDFGNNHRPCWRIMREGATLYPEQVKVPSWRQRNGDKRAAPGGRVPGDVLDFQYHAWLKHAYEHATKPTPMKAKSEGFSSEPIKPGPPEFNLNAELSDYRATMSPADRVGMWLSAALDDPGVCAEMKADIEAWFETQPGDVFDFPRVTGNSKQRCDWHPTQLHEDMVARCLNLSTTDGDRVIDPFGGTGTTGRVCKALGRDFTLIELDHGYCQKIAETLDLEVIGMDALTRPRAWGNRANPKTKS